MDINTLFNIFKLAIEKERNAYDFYMKAAAETSEQDVKELFIELANVESGHIRKLEKFYREIRERSTEA